MKIARKHLDEAVKANILSPIQAEKLWQFFHERPETSNQISLTNVLYYFGGFVGVGALGLLMGFGFEQFGTLGIFIFSLILSICGIILTFIFSNKKLITPKALSGTFVLFIFPLVVYSFLMNTGQLSNSNSMLFNDSFPNGQDVCISAVSLSLSFIFLYFFYHPLMIMPIILNAWYGSLALTTLLLVRPLDFELTLDISLLFGVGINILGFILDVRHSSEQDDAFWPYLLGSFFLWLGLTGLFFDDQYPGILYALASILLIGTGILLSRRSFIVFGTLGIAIYLISLATNFFAHSIFFPIALITIGIVFIQLGIFWQKNAGLLTERYQRFLPEKIKKILKTRE